MADTKAQIVLSAVDRTKAAFDQARRNIASIQTGAAGVLSTLNPLLGTVGLLGTALSALSFKSVVDGIDALNDVKDATGASIENISALEDVADRTGTSLQTVGDTLAKFNRQLTAAKPGSEIAETLKAIGVNAEELRRLDPAEALLRTAKALDQYADDGNKARIVQTLYGKSVQEVAPFLKDLAERGQLNAKVTTRQAEEAERFNKQLFEMQANLKEAARGIVSDLLPAVTSLLNLFKQARAESAGGSFLDGLLGTNPVARLEGQAELAQAAVRRAGDTLDRLVTEQQRKGEGADAFLDQRVAKARARLQQLQQQAAQAAQQLKELANVMDGGPAAAAAPAATQGAKPSVNTPVDPDAAKKAADQALANLRKVADGNVKAIGDALSATQDKLRFNEQFSRGIYEQGLQSLEAYYADQDAARQDNLSAIRRATEAEIAERQRLLNSPLLKGPERADERQGLTNQIAEARARLRAAEQEADQAARLSVGERERAIEALRDQVAGLDAQIQDLATGTSAGGDLLDIAQRVRAAQRLLVQGGAGEEDAAARAAQLGGLLEAQRQFSIARGAFAAVTQDAAIAEERLLLAADQSGAGLLETEGAVRELRTASLRQLEELIAATRELQKEAPQDTGLVAFLRDAELQAERLRAVLDPTKLRLDAAADDAAGVLTDGLRSAALEGGKLRDIVSDIDKRLTGLVFEELVGKPFQEGLSNILKGNGGKGLGENIFGSFFSALGFGGGGLGGAGGAGEQVGASAGQAATVAGLSAIGTTATTVTAPALASLGSTVGTVAVPALAGLGTTIGSTMVPALAALAGAASAASTALALISANQVGDAGGDALGAFIAAAGFDSGGYTGNAGTKQAAGVVHGQEFVFSAPAVKRLGIDTLEKLHESARTSAALKGLPGFEMGGYVGVRPARSAQRSDDGGAGRGRSIVLQSSPTFVVQGGRLDKATMGQAAAAYGRALRAELDRGTA